MLDIRWMRENRQALAEAMVKLNDQEAPWELALTLDEKRRELLQRGEKLREERNSGSRHIGALFRDKRTEEAGALKERMSEIGAEIAQIDERLRAVETEFRDAMMRIPNPPEPDVPVAPDEEGNVVLSQWGELPQFDFTPQAHWDLGPQLDIIDFERGGCRFGQPLLLSQGCGGAPAAGPFELVSGRAHQ